MKNQGPGGTVFSSLKSGGGCDVNRTVPFLVGGMIRGVLDLDHLPE